MSQEVSRREVIRRALVMAGTAGIVGSTTFLTACSTTQARTETAATSGLFSTQDIAWLDEVAETILPETDTPGAKAAEVGAFIALMVTDTYSPEKQARFRAGMTTLEKACQSQYGSGFMAASQESRLALLTQLDQQRVEQQEHYFAAIKELTVLGFFTSEVGYTQALRYMETPGRYEPCLDYTPGERAWARHA